MRLESVGSGSGSKAYIPGLAADAASTAAGLSTHRPSSPREVRACARCDRTACRTHAHGP